MAENRKPFKKDYINTEQDIDYGDIDNLNKGVSFVGADPMSVASRVMNFLGPGAVSLPLPQKTKVIVNESAYPKSQLNKRLLPKSLAIPDANDKEPSFKALPGYDPAMMEHERVHAGQFKLRDIPSADQAKKLLLGSVNDGDQFMYRHYGNPWGRNDAFEVPATALTSNLPGMDDSYREKVYDYLDEVYKKNPDSAAVFEAYLPDRLVKQYIQDRPRPYPKTELQKKLGSW
jgi:hypothetical protein